METTFSEHVDGYYDVENQLPRHVASLAEAAFDARERDRAAIDSVDAAERHRERMRERFVDAVGGFPDEKTDLRPEVTGTLEREGYAIEKVVFESQPGLHVTANCYLPSEVEDPAPGVLFLCGHSDDGKAEPLYQRGCIDLARNGMVALAIDPVGQGERHQYYDPETGECPRRTTAEHTYLDRRYALAGANVARHLVWDGIRAVDYLVSRPEVDEDRLGVTGNSGGGTQTAYVMLAEDRLDAAVPCCFITSREAYMPTGQPQDGEQIIDGSLDGGPTYDDFLAAFAPDPVRIGSARSDYFPIEGARRSYERARDVYALFDAADAIDHAVADETHGFSRPLRGAAVNWFLEHLLGRDPTFEPGDPAVESPETLWCTDDGEVTAAYPDGRTVQDCIAAYVRRTAPGSTSPPDPETLRDGLIERFDLDRERGPINPRRIETERREDLVWEKVFFPSEPGIVVTGVVARRPDVDADDLLPTVALYEDGTDALRGREAAFADLARSTGFALAFDPRGIGAVRSRDVNVYDYEGVHGTVYKLGSDARMVGTSLLGMQVFDVLRARDYLCDRLGDSVDLGVRGYGGMAWRALYAAAVEPAFGRIAVEETPSFRELAAEGREEYDPWLSVPDVIDAYDRPHLEAALGDRDLRRID